MGVIVRQGVKHSTVTMIATIIGMANLLFVYPFFFDQVEFGFFKYFLSSSQLVFPFILFGIGQVSIKYFSQFRAASEKGNGFLLFLLISPFFIFVLYLLLTLICKEWIISFFDNHEDKTLILQYFPLIPLLIFSMMYSKLLTLYISNFKRIVVPEILNNLWVKVAVPGLTIIYYFNIISYFSFFVGLIFVYFGAMGGLLVYLSRLGELDLSYNKKLFTGPLLKEIGSFAIYSVLVVVGSLLATQIDLFMVGTFINSRNVAIYTIAISLVTVIGIPFKSLSYIAAPIIAESWAKNDLSNIAKLYRKSSLNLLIIGLIIMIGIWASVDQLFQIIPNGQDYIAGKFVILLLGFAKLFDMVSGLNTHIILYSKFYKYNLYFSLLLGFLNILFNLFLIQKFNILGVAIATLSSMLIFNIMKSLFVWTKFKIQPFSTNMFWVLIIGGIAYGLTLILPKTSNPLIDIILNSTIITLIYVPGVLYFNLSEDLTKIKQEIVKKGKQLFL